MLSYVEIFRVRLRELQGFHESADGRRPGAIQLFARRATGAPVVALLEMIARSWKVDSVRTYGANPTSWDPARRVSFK